MIFFIIKHMHFIKIKTLHILHKLSFHNTIPHRSHSLIGHVIEELWFFSVLHFSTLKLLFFSYRKSLRFLAHIVWNCAFFPRNVCEKCKTQTKNYHWVILCLSVVRQHFKLLWPAFVRCPASSGVRKLFYLNNFFYETTYCILTRLDRNDPWVVLYQSCSNRSSWLH